MLGFLSPSHPPEYSTLLCRTLLKRALLLPRYLGALGRCTVSSSLSFSLFPRLKRGCSSSWRVGERKSTSSTTMTAMTREARLQTRTHGDDANGRKRERKTGGERRREREGFIHAWIYFARESRAALTSERLCGLPAREVQRAPPYNHDYRRRADMSRAATRTQARKRAIKTRVRGAG